MAMQPFTIHDIESAAEDLAMVAAQLKGVAKEMRDKAFPTLVLQAGTAFRIYVAKLLKLSAEAEIEFRDQYRCSINGALPRWKVNQKIVEAQRAARGQDREEGITPQPKPDATPSRKKPRTRRK